MQTIEDDKSLPGFLTSCHFGRPLRYLGGMISVGVSLLAPIMAGRHTGLGKFVFLTLCEALCNTHCLQQDKASRTVYALKG
jgi:hypothetical protein